MSSSRVVLLAFSVLLLVTTVLAGCVSVTVVDRSKSLDGMPDSERDIVEEHDLAVLAVDFDPPLNYQEIMACKSRGEGITLLVAIENTGVNTEQNVLVQARLSERSSGTLYIEKRGTIETIAPGEIKIVQLRDTDVPFSFEYTLAVSVIPVIGETRLDDNLKTYDLLITQS
jgi:hypothetical protein